MLRNWSSGDLFGLTQNAGMGWNPAELGKKEFLILSTQGGMRAADGSGELPVASYELFSGTEVLGRMALDRMLAGLSTRRYDVGLEPVDVLVLGPHGDDRAGPGLDHRHRNDPVLGIPDLGHAELAAEEAARRDVRAGHARSPLRA